MRGNTIITVNHETLVAAMQIYLDEVVLKDPGSQVVSAVQDPYGKAITESIVRLSTRGKPSA